jgi:hypothetical protein
MGHAAFERAQEDKDAHQELLKEEEQLWAAMASPVDINYRLVDWNGKLPKRRRRPRAMGSNPRAVQTKKLRSQVPLNVSHLK